MFKAFQPKYEHGTATLHIPQVFVEDTGVYTCKAINPAGEATTAAYLTVQGIGLDNETSNTLLATYKQFVISKCTILSLLERK